MDKVEELLKNLKKSIDGDRFWLNEIESNIETNRCSVHLAVFIEPYLQWILEGKKIIESRFSVNRCAPYRKIIEGDIIILKKSGGPIVAIAKAGKTWFYDLEPESWKDIKDNFAKALCAQDPSFWESRKAASYATLIKLDHVSALESFNFPKKDRRGWVVLKNSSDLKLDI